MHGANVKSVLTRSMKRSRFSVYVQYVQCLCTVRAVFMYSVCSVYVQYVQCLCTVYAVSMYSTCSVYVQCMQCLCTVRAVFMYSVCKIEWAALFVYLKSIYNHTVHVYCQVWVTSAQDTFTKCS